MIATLAILVLLAIGFSHWSLWFIVIFGLINAAIGFYIAKEKVAQLKATGASPVTFFVGTLPLHFAVSAVIYGIGYGIGALF